MMVKRSRLPLWLAVGVLAVVVTAALGAVATTPAGAAGDLKVSQPTFTTAAAFDVSRPLRDLVKEAVPASAPDDEDTSGPASPDGPFVADGAIQSSLPASATVGGPIANFEGLSNQDGFNVNGFRVNPPDPVGDVGPNNYVEMVNLVFAVYDKQGNRLTQPASLGSLWQNFPITDCAGQSGDPVVLYDQITDRWILSQFTSAGPEYWNCVAVSTSGDPTGTYYRYAFSAGAYFPDYPKYGVWTDSYVLTTREFGPVDEYRIGVYALEKNKMVNGEPNARAVSLYVDGLNPETNLPLIGDGLLPADIDGKQKPKTDTAVPIVGTQDAGGPYGATSDALNVWDLLVKWRSIPTASLTLKAQLPVAAFDSIFPCTPTSRDCLPQPGVTDRTRYLDILSYRQRPTYRLAYRNFKDYESLVTNQSVEATPGMAGVRWYEIRRDAAGTYSVYQQGTFAPGDGVHRWMGSIAQDKQGNTAVGYSVVNGTTVYPGIRYTGRLAGDPLGQMTLGEGTIVNGSGVQTTTNSRWGDYTSMNVDPVDDCTFWYVNEYYTAAGQASSPAGWQTRIASFKLPGCS